MKYFFLVIILFFTSSISNAQEKTVKFIFDSSKVYFRYFYKSKTNSEEHINDSVRLVARKISDNKFYLDKFIYKEKVWTRIYSIELAKDSLPVTTRAYGKDGKKKFIYTKEPYYNSTVISD